MAETMERAFARLGCRGEEQSRDVEGDKGFVQTGDKRERKKAAHGFAASCANLPPVGLYLPK